MARREAQSFWCPRSSWDHGGRLAARHTRINSPEGGCACYLRRLIGVGPRFNPGLSVRDLTASSWRGLLVVPGGAQTPPECLVATRPAGAAPRPASQDAS